MEIEIKQKVQDKQEIQTKKKVEYKKIGSIKPIPGLKLWKCDSELNLVEVQIEKSGTCCDFRGNSIINRKVQYDPKCLYTQALNRENAEKKIKKLLNIPKHVKVEFKNLGQ